MIKYWKSMILTALTIGILIFFYVQVSSYSDDLPQFSLQKIAGDEKAVEPLQIGGDIDFTMLDFESFKVGAKGTDYLRDQSYFKRLEGHYVPDYIEKLRDKYKGFMRGKETHPDFYYEDDQLLAYATTAINFWGFYTESFQIDVLHKDTKERQTFTLGMAEAGSLLYEEVEGIQVVDNVLHIITKSETGDETGLGETQYIVQNYSVDLEKESLISVDEVQKFSATMDDDGYSDVEVILNKDPDNPNFMVMHYNTTFEEYEDNGNMVESEYSKVEGIETYDITSNEGHSLEITDDHLLPIAYIEDTIYVAAFEDENMHVASYDVNEEEYLKELDIEMEGAELPYSELIYQNGVHDGKFYFASDTNMGDGLPLIAVMDLDDMKVNYKGEVKLEEADGDDNYNLIENDFTDAPLSIYFSEMDIKENE